MTRKHVLDAKKIIARLWQLGWLNGLLRDLYNAINPADLQAIVGIYQRFHGLDADGWVGPQTSRHLYAQRCCGLAESLPQEGLPRWPDNHIVWTLMDKAGWPHVDFATVKTAFQWAWSQWAAVCGISPSYTDNASLANVTVECKTIDGAGQILAWSELADGTENLKRQRFDAGETWVVSETLLVGQISLPLVARHEIGHVMGIPHLTVGNAMAPVYDSRVKELQSGDVAEGQARYGPPLQAPMPPAPPVSPPPSEAYVVTFTKPVTSVVITAKAA